MPTIMHYQKRYPQVAVELTLSQHVHDLIDEGYDVAVRLNGTSLPNSDLISIRIGKSYNILCASPSYLAERGDPCVGGGACRPSSLGSARSQWQGSVRVPLSPYQVNIAGVMVFALRDGLGVGVLPLWTALQWLRK